MHPGGVSVFFDESIRKSLSPCAGFRVADPSPSPTAGQDATEAFYALHRHEVLQRPQYARLVVGSLQGEQSVIESKVTGATSKVPYAEPTWLSEGYYSPFYKEVQTVFCFVLSLAN